MGFVNVGASTLDGHRIKTKAALKALLVGNKSKGVKATPSEVLFDSTSPLGPLAGTTLRGDDLPAEHTLQVVGPDPYSDRRWYASVSRKSDGSIVIR